MAPCFSWSSHSSDFITGIDVADLRIGSKLKLAGPVSVYYDWVRQQAGSATSVSVWQHIKLSSFVLQIHFVCC